jgi:glycosyltransferase involved in cell wall biosynthesis
VGGVTQYFRSLRPHWRTDVAYFTVGSRADNEGAAKIALRMIRDTASFVREAKRGGFDLVHLNPSLGGKAALRDGVLLLAAKALRKPVVIFVHGWEQDFEKRLLGLPQVTALVLNRADGMVVLGAGFVGRLRKLGYRKKIFVQAAPIDQELLDDSRQHRSPGVGDGGKFTILFLARVEREKGIYEALDAFGILKSRYPFVRMIVAGDGPELEPARRACDGERVTFTGRVRGETKYAVFRAADAYLFPSHHEGLPISVLEAMAYGLPVVTSCVGGLPDFFVDGQMGFMADSRDPEEYAELLERLIADRGRAGAIGSFNRQYATEHFSAARIAAGLEQIYDAVLKNPHRAALPA